MKLYINEIDCFIDLHDVNYFQFSNGVVNFYYKNGPIHPVYIEKSKYDILIGILKDAGFFNKIV